MNKFWNRNLFPTFSPKIHGRFSSTKLITPNLLTSILCKQIRASGPINVSEYMKFALYHPTHGYYQKCSVLGPDGDFITSPELSQIFGELFGIWIVNEWMTIGTQSSFDIVEFGPGRGTLLANIFRAIGKFPETCFALKNVHLIERSSQFREVQKSILFPLLESLRLTPEVFWYSSLNEVPQGQPTYYIAHEFLDALPIHRFQRTDDGNWNEIFVTSTNAERDELAFIALRENTMAKTVYLKMAGDLSDRSCVEVCPEAGAILQKVALRIAEHSGAALFADYGHLGESGDTLRAFKNHEIHDPLSDPGEADITADVDFGFLMRSIEETNANVTVHGPVSQAYFLVHMGLLARLKVLLDKLDSEEDRRNLIASTEILVSSKQMGKRYKFMAILPANADGHIPAGFFPTWEVSS